MSYGNQQRYVRELGVYSAVLKQAFARQQQGQSKPAIFIDFQTKDGSIASARLNNPIKKKDYFTLTTLFNAFGKVISYEDLQHASQDRCLTELAKYVGKEVLILVSPHEWKGKCIWNVSGFWAQKFAPTSGASNNTAPAGGSRDPFGSDDPAQAASGPEFDPFADDPGPFHDETAMGSVGKIPF